MQQQESLGDRVLIFGTRSRPPTVEQLRLALPGWQVEPEGGGWLREPIGFRLLHSDVSLHLRTLAPEDARTTLAEHLQYIADVCLAEDAILPQRLRAAQHVLEVRAAAADAPGQDGVLPAIRTVADLVLGVVARAGVVEDAAGRLLARLWPADLPRPEAPPEPGTEERAAQEAHLARRARSQQIVTALGYPTPPPHLPSVDGGELRAEEEVVQRALVLHVALNIAHRMPPELAQEWLQREGLLAALTPAEERLLCLPPEARIAPLGAFEAQVEALWALAWALGQVPTLDFGTTCGDQLASLFPDLPRGEGSQRFRSASRLRSPAELLEALDAAYCLTWGAVELSMADQTLPAQLSPDVLWERRRALEWLHGDDWDEPNLST